MKDLDANRMAGTWYVIKKVATTSTCMSAVYTATPLKIVLTNVGELSVAGSEPSVMRLKWDNFASNALRTTYTIVDTDYDNYAIDAECQSLYVARRVSATILSRTKTLDPAVLQEAEQRLVAEGFELSSLSTVDHSNCFEPSEVDYSLIYDKDGVRAGLQDDDGNSLVEIQSEADAQAYLETLGN